jgi:OOP family OmpA-OmpF porin
MNAKRFLAASIACASVTATTTVIADDIPEQVTTLTKTPAIAK